MSDRRGKGGLYLSPSGLVDGAAGDGVGVFTQELLLRPHEGALGGICVRVVAAVEE